MGGCLLVLKSWSRPVVILFFIFYHPDHSFLAWISLIKFVFEDELDLKLAVFAWHVPPSILFAD